MLTYLLGIEVNPKSQSEDIYLVDLESSYKMSTSANTKPPVETPIVRKEGESKIYVPNVDVIYHNMHAGSDFKTIRGGSEGPVEDILLEVARHVKEGCYKIVSISSSKHSFVVVCSTELSKAELWRKGFPFPGTKGKDKPN